MSVTLKDIAKIANVSHTTVSRALNDSPYISAKTKEKILRIVGQLNYSPNISAKGLVTNRIYNIALFFSSLAQGTSPNFFYETVEGAYSVLNKNYHMVLREIGGDASFPVVGKNRFDGINHNFALYAYGLLNIGDMSDVVCDMAPKPFLMTNGTQDGIFPIDGVREIAATAGGKYASIGRAEYFKSVVFEGGHSFPPAVKAAQQDLPGNGRTLRNCSNSCPSPQTKR
jgi:transcriptional regulator with XRE-family HTH domain